MLSPNNMAIRQLLQEEGISEATLHKWRSAARGKGELLLDADVGPAPHVRVVVRGSIFSLFLGWAGEG